MKRSVAVLLICMGMVSCSRIPRKEYLFEFIEASESQIHFSNTISTDNEINIIDFQYCYNGGGVGVGDFNSDNLPDLVFTGNQVGVRLYLNQGELKFKDVTEISGLKTNNWLTGVTIVDINSDGLTDIYLNVGGANCNADCNNLLFVQTGKNKNGVPLFEEKAVSYGLSDPHYSQQTVFFDYDLDGDLDAFILRNGNVQFDKNSPLPKKYFPEHLADALLENIEVDSLSHPFFKDVSHKMGISKKGFGLGLGIHDFDDNGFIDVYVGNDFISNDLLYLNYGKSGSAPVFKEAAQDYFQHQTYNAMGLDIADLNGDSKPEVLVLDMLPQDYERQKKMLGALNYDKYNLALLNGYSPQFMRNTLHLNNGFVHGNPVKFSDISFFSKTAKTDWSWAPLIADYDFDGDNDIFITNGYGKDITNLDFINYTQQNNIFGTPEARNTRLKELVANLPSVKMGNYFFENTSTLEFEDRSHQWLPQHKSLSNGAAYADLDLDGDLDLVVNNIDENAYVLKNTSSEREGYKYLKVKLVGPKRNPRAIGAKIFLWENGRKRIHFQSVVRGYLSSVEDGGFFGLKKSNVDSVKVVWPNGKETIMKDIPSNQTVHLFQNKAKEIPIDKETKNYIFKAVPSVIDYRHNLDFSNEFSRQHLLQTQHSIKGPILASSSEGNDHLVFLSGGLGEPGSIWKENTLGKFELVQKLDSIHEDSDALFFDVDGDNDMDLYVASGGNHQEVNANVYLDRLFLNHGEKGFLFAPQSLPEFLSPTSCVREVDFDRDGDLDVFVGSNIIPHSYPKAPKQRLLENHNGKFIEKEVPAFNGLGMVKDAVWSDIDLDGWPDLLVVGEWMALRVFKNNEGTLQPISMEFLDRNSKLIETSGWYKTVVSGDFDEDGDMDFLIGNQGQNNFVDPTPEHPMYIYKGDYDKNGSVDPVLGGYYSRGKEKVLLPLNSRDDVMKQLPELKNRFNSYDDFTKTDYQTLLQIQRIEEETLKVSNSKSIYLENKGGTKFMVHPLPKITQLGPITSILVDDFDDDGHLDALLAGNDFYAESNFGRFDALTGIFLKGVGDGNFNAIPSSESGFYLPNHTTSMNLLKTKQNERIVIGGQSNDSLKTFVLETTRNK
ncbi:MAG: VCBS repeat-containing protein [Bacteroidota bacterium]